MRLIDTIYLEKPYLGSRLIVDALADHKHIGGPSWTGDFVAPSAAQDISMPAAKPGYQSRQSGLVYIPMASGFLYLTVIMGWYSRKVLSWCVSNRSDFPFNIIQLVFILIPVK